MLKRFFSWRSKKKLPTIDEELAGNEEIIENEKIIEDNKKCTTQNTISEISSSSDHMVEKPPDNTDKQKMIDDINNKFIESDKNKLLKECNSIIDDTVMNDSINNDFNVRITQSKFFKLKQKLDEPDCEKKIKIECEEKEQIKKINWNDVSKTKYLNEDYIEKHANELNWKYICQYQKLSIQFMTKFSHKLHWKNVTYYQSLTEEFALKFCNKIHWGTYSYLYKVKDNRLQKFIIKSNNWLYKTRNEKRVRIQSYYKIHMINCKEYIECFKAVNDNYSSLYSPDGFIYKCGNKYVTQCDYNEDHYISKGFGSWTYANAVKYGIRTKKDNFKILKCLVPLDSVCMVEDGKLRSSEIIITAEVK